MAAKINEIPEEVEAFVELQHYFKTVCFAL
jgi:hypothetical protein